MRCGRRCVGRWAQMPAWMLATFEVRLIPVPGGITVPNRRVTKFLLGVYGSGNPPVVVLQIGVPGQGHGLVQPHLGCGEHA